jgi:hypothetical protein
MAMIRGALIAVIYEKMLSLKSGNASESAAMTLMGTDVERIVETWYLLVVEIWASLIQLVIAIFLLERQLGAVCIAPVIVALGKFLPRSHAVHELMVCSGNGTFYEIGNSSGWSTKNMAAGYSEKNQLHVRDPRVHDERQDAWSYGADILHDSSNASKRDASLETISAAFELEFVYWL